MTGMGSSPLARADDPPYISSTRRSGSSPLARGGLPARPAYAVPWRLIPARAGRTSGPCRTRRWLRAHPRSRGADGVSTNTFPQEAGSSPLARGGRRRWRRHWCRSGAHPRSRGADDHVLLESRVSDGSSPLARGGPGCPCVASGRGRLIPARAGRTRRGGRRPTGRWAHPRSRGADNDALTVDAFSKGSSPLARGGHHRHRIRVRRAGLIPARAGRTSPSSRWERTTGAHPRSRGADFDHDGDTLSASGSSPLARGGLAQARERLSGLRLIPARAGRTCRSPGTGSGRTAHPRSRGADARPRR